MSLSRPVRQFVFSWITPGGRGEAELDPAVPAKMVAAAGWGSGVKAIREPIPPHREDVFERREEGHA